MTPFAVAGVQMYVSANQDNVAAMSHQIDLVLARFPWVQMVVFSELAPFGPLPSNAPESNEATVDVFRECARKHNVWLLPGSMFERVGDRLYNVAYVLNPQGETVARYAKMFPFLPYEEGTASGTEFCVFDVPDVGRFGVSICYDIWFPETTRQLVSMGAEVLLHPVLTGTTDRDIELSIARATAAMFQCYVFDINGLGPGGTGRSLVVDPSGTVLYQAAGQHEVIPVEVDFDMVRRTRAVGLRGLGQTLKSFRDTPASFPVYDKNVGSGEYLESLGELSMPTQADPRGIGVPTPASVVNNGSPSYIDPLTLAHKKQG